MDYLPSSSRYSTVSSSPLLQTGNEGTLGNLTRMWPRSGPNPGNEILDPGFLNSSVLSSRNQALCLSMCSGSRVVFTLKSQRRHWFRALPAPTSCPNLLSLESFQVLLVGCPLLPERGLGLPLSLHQLLGHQLLVQSCLLLYSCHLLPQARQLPCTGGMGGGGRTGTQTR